MTRVSCPNQSQIWLNILTEEGTDRGVHKGGKYPMPDPSPKVTSHTSIVENLDIFKRTVDTLRKIRAS